MFLSINNHCLRENIFRFGKTEWKSLFSQLFPAHGMLLLKGRLYQLKKSMVKDDEKRIVQHDQKAKNILTFGLSSDEFFCTARCKSEKEIWKILEVGHEDSVDVRRARKHTLVSEYEVFRMKNGETISELQTRFTHIVNHFFGLGKMFEDDELNIKILNFLTRTWEPKSQ